MFRKISIVILAAFFTAAGAYHLISPETYLPAMPGYLPWPLALIYLSGAAEMLGGIGICFTNWRRPAGWVLIALLVAVFPANVHMLTADVPINGRPVPEWIYWARLPLQGVLIGWVYGSCVRSKVAGVR